MTYNQNIKPTSLPLGGLCWRYDYLEILEKAMRATIILVFILISPTVLAEKESIPKDRTITELVVYENLVMVLFSPDFSNTQNCSSGSSKALQLYFNSESGTNIGLLSTLLAAAAASKKVGFGISECAGQYPRIYRVDVRY